MTLRPLIFLLISGTCISLASCDNELDVTAEYKEIGVIYGVLNPSDSVHYVRIQKAFLGDGNALVMSQVPDSTYYPDILDVWFEEISNGVVVNSFGLTRFIGPDKEPGDFPSSPNILYRTNGEVLNRTNEYRIVVHNTQSGNEFSAQTLLVDTVKIVRPSVSGNTEIRWVNKSGPANDPPFYNDVPVEFLINPKAEVYNLTIRFHFTEETQAGTTSKYIDWIFANDYINQAGATNISYNINGENFYKFVGSRLEPDNAVIQRTAVGLDFIIAAGSEVLANFVSINSATTSILTSIPQYTNVVNGTGIFAARFVSVSPDKPMGTLSLDSLSEGIYTQDLGFQ